MEAPGSDLALAEEDQPITEEMIEAAIQREEEALQTDPDFDYTTFRPTPLERVQTLHLSFLRIPKVANLDALTTLTDLRLDNNRIERIEGLERLVELRALNLSFNRIPRIEGLQTLSKLRDLSLYGNRLTEVGGLEGCAGSLEIVSLGGNSIASMDALLYFRRFPALRVLAVDGNPLCANTEYRTHALAFLTQLQYLDYELIRPDEREAARKGGVPLEEIQRIEGKDRKDDGERASRAEHTKHVAELEAHGIGAAATLLDDMFADDTHWAKLEGLPGVQELVLTFRESFTELAKEFTLRGMEASAEIAKEIGMFERALRAVLTGAEREASALVLTFLHDQKHAFTSFRASFRDWQIKARAADTAYTTAVSTTSYQDPSPPLRQPPLDRTALSALPGACLATMGQLRERETDRAAKVQRMLDAFDSAMSELRERKMQAHQTFFRGCESLEREFSSEMSAIVQRVADEVAAFATGPASATPSAGSSGTSASAAAAAVAAAAAAGSLVDPEATVEEKRSYLPPELSGLSDDTVHLLFQREDFIAVAGNSHDARVSRMNEIEDTADKWELARCSGAVKSLRTAEREHNRVRLREIEAMEDACAAAIREQLSRAIDDAVAADGEEFVRLWLYPSVRDVIHG